MCMNKGNSLNEYICIKKYILKKIYFFLNYFATYKLNITIILIPTFGMCEIGYCHFNGTDR